MLHNFRNTLLCSLTSLFIVACSEQNPVDTSVKETIQLTKQNSEVQDLWKTVTKTGGVTTIGNDETNRPRFVNLQACIEASLASLLKDKKIAAVVGVIHTPLPATPLRTAGEITPGLIAKEVQNDPKRLETVMKRPNIIRDFLANGGKLLVVYPKAALATPIPGLDIYESLRQLHKTILDKPVETFAPEMTGATYLIKDNKGKVYCFSIKAYQASAPQAQMEWGLWFGPLDNPKVQERFKAVNDYLLSQGINIQGEL